MFFLYMQDETNPDSELKALAKDLQKKILANELGLEDLRTELCGTIDPEPLQTQQSVCSPCQHGQYNILQPLHRASECEKILKEWKKSGGTRSQLEDILQRRDELNEILKRLH